MDINLMAGVKIVKFNSMSIFLAINTHNYRGRLCSKRSKVFTPTVSFNFMDTTHAVIQSGLYSL